MAVLAVSEFSFLTMSSSEAEPQEIPRCLWHSAGRMIWSLHSPLLGTSFPVVRSTAQAAFVEYLVLFPYRCFVLQPFLVQTQSFPFAPRSFQSTEGADRESKVAQSL